MIIFFRSFLIFKYLDHSEDNNDDSSICSPGLLSKPNFNEISGSDEQESVFSKKFLEVVPEFSQNLGEFLYFLIYNTLEKIFHQK